MLRQSAPTNSSRLPRSSSLENPCLDLGVNPANCVLGNIHALRKSTTRLQTIDHCAAQARNSADVAKAQKRQRRRGCSRLPNRIFVRSACETRRALRQTWVRCREGLAARAWVRGTMAARSR
jgi:hypothetical protein